MDSVLQAVERSIQRCAQCIGRQVERSAVRAYPAPRQPEREGVCSGHALQRAMVLLWDHLDAAQRYTFWWKGGFLQRAATNTWWLVTAQGASGIYELRQSNPRMTAFSHCAVLRSSAPLPDHLLAQKCWLESDPRRLLRVAVRHPLEMELVECLGAQMGTLAIESLYPDPPPRPRLTANDLATWYMTSRVGTVRSLYGDTHDEQASEEQWYAMAVLGQHRVVRRSTAQVVVYPPPVTPRRSRR